MSRIKAALAILATFLTVIFNSLFAQIDQSDLFNLQIDQLSDIQIRQLIYKAREAGYTAADIVQLARARGIPEDEILALQDRIAELEETKTPEQERLEIETKELRSILEVAEPPPKTEYFGYEMFDVRYGRLSFESSLSIPVPKNYVLGPKDFVVINIYGESEKNYSEVINSSGYIFLRNIGPIYLSGLNLIEAERRVKSKLGAVYKELVSNDPKTFMQFSLGGVRSLSVSLTGELKRPGTYTVNGLSTVFNAVYLSGGPTTDGTMREVKLFRDSKLVASVDYYDFLMNGESAQNLRLKEGDIINVGPFLNRVTIEGAVKRPGKYELKDDETFEDLLYYAGGFAADAYQERISVTRNTDTEKVVSDIFKDQFKLFYSKAGDKYVVGTVLDRYENRVTIEGAIYRPGEYALVEGLTVKQLIKRAEGLKGDAFLSRAQLLRERDDLNSEVISLDLGKILNDEAEDIVLEREDRLKILSIHDLGFEKQVQISGEVKQPGIHEFSEGMTLNDLIFLANGFNEAASTGTIEISRRPGRQSSDNLAEVIQVSIDSTLEKTSEEVNLMPYDHVIVRRNPNFFVEKSVLIYGEVLYPGKYILSSEQERISDLIIRAGYTKSAAYLKGVTLLRKTEFYRNSDEGVIEESETGEETADQDANLDLTTKAKQERLRQLSKNNPFLEGIEIEEVESIALNMEAILKEPGSSADLVLEEGDIINVPKELTTIRLRGRVLYPNTVRFEDKKGLKYFIGKAGGFGARAMKKRTYVVYANGEVSRTKGFFFFRKYPVPEPGAEVIVPVKPLKVPIKPGEFIGITSGLATIALLITQIVQ